MSLADLLLLWIASAAGIALAIILWREIARAERAENAARRAADRAQWHIVHVSPHGRGPNADRWYWAPPDHQGHAVHLTDETLIAAKVMANRNLARPHQHTAP